MVIAQERNRLPRKKVKKEGSSRTDGRGRTRAGRQRFTFGGRQDSPSLGRGPLCAFLLLCCMYVICDRVTGTARMNEVRIPKSHTATPSPFWKISDRPRNLISASKEREIEKEI